MTESKTQVVLRKQLEWLSSTQESDKSVFWQYHDHARLKNSKFIISLFFIIIISLYSNHYPAIPESYTFQQDLNINTFFSQIRNAVSRTRFQLEYVFLFFPASLLLIVNAIALQLNTVYNIKVRLKV